MLPLTHGLALFRYGLTSHGSQALHNIWGMSNTTTMAALSLGVLALYAGVIMTAAIRLYVAKSDGEERPFRPVAGRKDEELTASEVLSATSELLRALRLGPMELALWYRRRPDEEVYSESPADREQARKP